MSARDRPTQCGCGAKLVPERGSEILMCSVCDAPVDVEMTDDELRRRGFDDDAILVMRGLCPYEMRGVDPRRDL